MTNVQGNEYENNLGDSAAALLSARKAVAAAETLLREDQSGLAHEVYEVIKKAHLTNEEKNSLFLATKSAIDRYDDDQEKRDEAILKAAPNEGNTQGLGDQIIAEVNIALPIKPLMTLEQSGLSGALYHIIAHFGPATVRQKNNILSGINTAINTFPNNEKERN